MTTSIYTGKMAYGLIGKETTYGTAVTANRDFGLLQSVSTTENNNLLREYSLGSANAQQITAGKYDVSHSIEFMMQHGRILTYILGTENSSSPSTSSSDRMHYWTGTAGTTDLSDSPPSFTFECGLNETTDIVKKFPGSVITSASISLGVDSILKCSADISSRTVDASTTTASASVIDDLPLFSGFTGAVKIGAAGSEVELANVQSFALTFNNYAGGEAKLWNIGSRLPQKALSVNRSIDFKYTVALRKSSDYAFNTAGGEDTLLDSWGEYIRFLAGSAVTAPTSTTDVAATSVILEADNGVAWGSGQRKFGIQLAGVKYTSMSTPIEISGYIVADISGFATNIGPGTTVNTVGNTACYWVDDITAAYGT